MVGKIYKYGKPAPMGTLSSSSFSCPSFQPLSLLSIQLYPYTLSILKMKFTPSFALAALTSLAVAAPHDIVNKRAVASGPVGYASTNGGTTGGQGGATTTVSTLAQFTKAATAKEPTVVYISGKITGNDKVRVSSDTSIIGLNSDSALENIGLFVNKVENVILRNFKSSKVLAKNGDAIGIQASKNVWADHLDLSSDLDHGKDYYDGLLDVTHASEWVTISNVFFHDHYKCKSLSILTA